MQLRTIRAFKGSDRGARVQCRRLAERLKLPATLLCCTCGVAVHAQSTPRLVIETYVAQRVTEPTLPTLLSKKADGQSYAAVRSKAALYEAYAQFGNNAVGEQPDGTVHANARTAMHSLFNAADGDAVQDNVGCPAPVYRPSRMLAAERELTRLALFMLVAREACSAGVSAGLLDALIIQESRYQIDAVSPKGAIGLTQLMPATAANLGVNSWSIADNIRGGARYLAAMLGRFGQVHLALAAYNAGPRAVTRFGGIPAFRETQSYVGDVIRRWSLLAQN